MPRISKTFKERDLNNWQMKFYIAFAVLWFLFFTYTASIIFSIISLLIAASLIFFKEYRKRRYFIYHYEFQGRVLYIEYRRGKRKLKKTIPLKDLSIEISSEFNLRRGGYSQDKTVVIRWDGDKIEQGLRPSWNYNEMLFLEKHFHDTVHWDSGNRMNK